MARNSTNRELTDREREVAIRIAQGDTNQEVATLLCISSKTVDTHRSKVMKKLELKNNVALVIYALKHAWITVDGLYTQGQLDERIAAELAGARRDPAAFGVFEAPGPIGS